MLSIIAHNGDISGELVEIGEMDSSSCVALSIYDEVVVSTDFGVDCKCAVSRRKSVGLVV